MPASQNGYSYVHGNPVNYTDSTGLCIDSHTGHVRMGEPPSGTSGICKNLQNGQGLDNVDIKRAWELNAGGNLLIVYPAAIAANTTAIVPIQVNTPYYTNGIIQGWTTKRYLRQPTEYAKGANFLSWALPLVNGAVYGIEIEQKLGCNIITEDQAYAQHGANIGFTTMNAVGGTVVLPVSSTAASTVFGGTPAGWATVGGVAFAFDMTVGQNTYNYMIEGDPMWTAFFRGRADAVDAYAGFFGSDDETVTTFFETWAGPPIYWAGDQIVNQCNTSQYSFMKCRSFFGLNE